MSIEGNELWHKAKKEYTDNTQKSPWGGNCGMIIGFDECEEEKTITLAQLFIIWLFIIIVGLTIVGGLVYVNSSIETPNGKDPFEAMTEELKP